MATEKWGDALARSRNLKTDAEWDEWLEQEEAAYQAYKREALRYP